MASKQGKAPQVDPHVVQTAARLYKERGELQDRLIDLEGKVQEHEVVLQSLDKLDNDRRCFRLMGGVLVERNVGQVHAAISGNLGQLKEVAKKTEDSFKRKVEEFQSFSKEHSIQIKPTGDGQKLLLVND